MQRLQALVTFLAFGWFAWGILSERFPGEPGGVPWLKALRIAVQWCIDMVGRIPFGLAVLAIGIAIATILLLPESDDDTDI